jgi:glycosyltransferase involved in cell wall biosynthesis
LNGELTARQPHHKPSCLMSLRVIYSFPHRIGVAGIGMIAWYQVKGLVEQGLDVHLYCGSCERPIPGLSGLTATMKLAGLRIPYRLLGSDRAFAWHDRVVARILTRERSRVDVVHCWPLGAYCTLLAAHTQGIPTVLERPNAHTGFAYDAVAAEHRKIGLPLLRSNTHAFHACRLKREEAEYRLATKLACPSDFVMHTFLSRGFSPSQIARHRYGFDGAQFVPGAARDAAAPTHQFTAAFVGRCEPRKGLHYALEAWHRSGAATSGRFLIAGTFVPGYEELLSRLLDHSSIERLGFVENPGFIMQQSDVFLLPSIEEGSALVTYEARACGCVLVVSDATGAVCEHLREGLVHPAGDVAGLTDHLRTLCASPQLLATMRTQSLLGVPSLSWQAAGKHLANIYESLVAQRNGHPA